MKKITLISLCLLGSLGLFYDIAAAQPQPKQQRSWYQSFHIADYLPDFLGKRITQWRIKRMFEGTEKYIKKILEESQIWATNDLGTTNKFDTKKVKEFIKEYSAWLDQFYDIITVKYPVQIIHKNYDNKKGYSEKVDYINMTILDVWGVRIQKMVKDIEDTMMDIKDEKAIKILYRQIIYLKLFEDNVFKIISNISTSAFDKSLLSDFAY